MIYPGGVVKRGTAELSPEIRVTPQTPPCFFAHAGDDRVSPENSVAMYLALKRAGVPGRAAHLRLGRPRLRHAAHGQARRDLAQAVRGVVARHGGSQGWHRPRDIDCPGLARHQRERAAAVSATTSTSATPPPVRDADRVLVVRNENSPVSQAVADDYAKRRAVQNVLSVRCQDSAANPANETISFCGLRASHREAPSQPSWPLMPNIDFIVLTKGIPIRIADAPGEAWATIALRWTATWPRWTTTRRPAP